MSRRAVCDCGWKGRCRHPLAAAEEAWEHEVLHWTEESCRAQGVPLHVSDPHTLRTIAVLMGAKQ